MTAATPGPWRYWTQKRTGGEDTCTFRNLDGAEVLRAVTVTLTEDDARLIAAAPELLTELTALLAMCERQTDFNDDGDGKMFDRVRAAIAKATGAA